MEEVTGMGPGGGEGLVARAVGEVAAVVVVQKNGSSRREVGGGRVKGNRKVGVGGDCC